MSDIRRRNVIRLFFICAILSLITNFPSGFTNSSVNTAVNELRSYIRISYMRRGWKLNDTMESLIRSAVLNCWFIAQIIGSFLSPFITDYYGRKISYLSSNASMTFAALVQYIGAVTYIPELLILGRTIAALSSPLSDASLILYIQESTPVQYRATFSFLGEIGYCLVCVLGMILGMQNVLGNNLPKLLMCAILPGIPFMLFLFYIPDTPKYLMICKRDKKEALKSLEFFQGNKIENEKILNDYLRENIHDNNKEQSSSIKELLTTWHLRHAVLLSCSVLVLTLSFYPILQSSTYFFQYININNQLSELSSTLLMIAFTISCIVGSLFIDRYPRRFLVLTFGFLSNLFLTFFVIFSVLNYLTWWMSYAALGSLFLYAITYGMVLGPVSWFVAPELVAQRHRSTVFCLCYGLTNCMITLTNFSTIPLYQIIGAYTFLPLFIIPSFICLIFLYHYLPETLGKETHEIISAMTSRRARVTSVTECL